MTTFSPTVLLRAEENFGEAFDDYRTAGSGEPAFAARGAHHTLAEARYPETIAVGPRIDPS
jgi:hypothetical protein